MPDGHPVHVRWSVPNPGAASPCRPQLAGLALFGALLIYNTATHTMWFDELQAWMIARASENPAALIANLRDEGHPALWHLLLWSLARITGNPVAMQVLHTLIGIAILYLLWIRSPFSHFEKTLLSLSYFLGFEYAAVARSYAPGVALLLLFVSLPTRCGKRVLSGWIVLGLMANTQFFLSLAALAMAALWWLHDGGGIKRHGPGLACFSLLLLAAVATMVLSDLNSVSSWHFELSGPAILNKLTKLAEAFVPLAGLTGYTYWRTSYPDALRAGIALIVFAALWRYLWPSRLALQAMTGLSVAVLGFFYLRYGGYSWHVGVIFAFFVALVWFFRERSTELGPHWILVALLSVNALGGAKAMVLSKLIPFSRSAATARWIRAEGLADAMWVATDWQAASVAGYLDRPLYYPRCDCDMTFVRWTDIYPGAQPAELPANLARAMAERGTRTAYAISTRRSSWDIRAARDRFRVETLARFEGAQLDHENFEVLRVTRRVSPAP